MKHLFSKKYKFNNNLKNRIISMVIKFNQIKKMLKISQHKIIQQLNQKYLDQSVLFINNHLVIKIDQKNLIKNL